MNINAIRVFILENKGKCLKIVSVSLVVIIALVMYLSNNLTKGADIVVFDAGASVIAEEKPAAIIEEKKEVFIVVDIAGAVNNPGVFSLPEGSRVNDAVEKAGGLAEKADTMNVNLAARLSDGDKVYIPKEQEKDQKNVQPAGIITSAVSGGSSASAGAAADGKVNINTANSEQLETLSGVGPATAKKIIDYRENSGSFKKIEDIKKVSGIGDKTFEKLKDKISV